MSKGENKIRWDVFHHESFQVLKLVFFMMGLNIIFHLSQFQGIIIYQQKIKQNYFARLFKKININGKFQIFTDNLITEPICFKYH